MRFTLSRTGRVAPGFATVGAWGRVWKCARVSLHWANRRSHGPWHSMKSPAQRPREVSHANLQSLRDSDASGFWSGDTRCALAAGAHPRWSNPGHRNDPGWWEDGAKKDKLRKDAQRQQQDSERDGGHRKKRKPTCLSLNTITKSCCYGAPRDICL